MPDLPGPGVDCLLADLGFASNQMDDVSRGLAFSGDGPLDMRLDPGADITAERLVNSLPEKELADLIYEFGEERLSRRIARKIVEQRRIEPITTTSGLADLVRRCYPRPGPRALRGKGPKRPGRKPWESRPGGWRGHRIDPATRTFMALRIAVNDELGSLDSLLEGLPGLLNPGGRAAVISFHSLEDRRVKRAYQALRQERGYDLLTRKPVTAEEQETDTNPRSRSAKMRVIQKPATA
jgi:16S rRNA (cytosine1402-N4)-methyltransferase